MEWQRSAARGSIALRNIHGRRFGIPNSTLAIVLISLVSISSYAFAWRLPKDGFGRLCSYFVIGQDSAFQRGLTALKEDRPETALAELTVAESEHPVDGRVRNFRGIVLARLGRNVEAASEYREAIRLDPSMEDAYRNIGFLEWKEQMSEHALEDLQHAIELSPEDSFAHYYLGRVQLDAQRYDKAFHELSLSGVSWPAEPEFLVAAATGYLAVGRQEELRQTLDRALLLPLSATQGVRVASLLLAVHQNDRAIEVLKKFATAETDRQTSWMGFDLGMAYLLAGSNKMAVEQAQLCIDHRPPTASDPAANASAWSIIGIAAARMGKSDLSVSALRQATRLAPALEEYWLNLTRELMALDRYEDAISATRQGLAINSSSYALHLRLGAANLAGDHFAEAENIFRELVVAGDPLPTSYIGLAQVLLRTGRADEATSELVEAQRRLGPNFLISYFRGLALNRSATPSGAVEAFQEALQLNPDSVEAHLELAKTELALGNAIGALSQLKETLRLDPGNVQATHLLMRARRRAGQEQHADGAADLQRMPEDDSLGDFVLPQWQVPAN